METVLQSGGNFYTSLKSWQNATEAVFDRSKPHYLAQDQLFQFDKERSDSLSGLDAGSEANALYAHHYAVALSAQAGQLDTTLLDQLQTIAVKHHFVSPYSSMICLVNERQKERLKELSGEKDRYNREAETGNDPVGLMDVQAVPEPHEWVLIISGLGLLLFLYRRKWMRLARLPR
jgi:hypothetical protein